MAVATYPLSVRPARSGGPSQKRLWRPDCGMAPRPLARLGRAPVGGNSFAAGRILGSPRGAAKVARAPLVQARLVTWTLARADVSSLAGTTEICDPPDAVGGPPA